MLAQIKYVAAKTPAEYLGMQIPRPPHTGLEQAVPKANLRAPDG